MLSIRLHGDTAVAAGHRARWPTAAPQRCMATRPVPLQLKGLVPKAIDPTATGGTDPSSQEHLERVHGPPPSFPAGHPTSDDISRGHVPDAPRATPTGSSPCNEASSGGGHSSASGSGQVEQMSGRGSGTDTGGMGAGGPGSAQRDSPGATGDKDQDESGRLGGAEDAPRSAPTPRADEQQGPGSAEIDESGSVGSGTTERGRCA